MGKLFLLSKSISIPLINKAIKKALIEDNVKNIAIITTAHRELKECSHGSKEAKKYLEYEMGFFTNFIDLDKKEDISEYNAFYFVGGNPIYLMNSIIENEYFNIFTEKYLMNKIIIGNSAGASILGDNLKHIKYFAPEFKDKTSIPKSFGFINYCILPHANNYTEEIPQFMKDNPKQKILAINDFNAYENIEERLNELK